MATVGTADIKITADFSDFEGQIESFFGRAGEAGAQELDSATKAGVDAAESNIEGLASSVESASSDINSSLGKAGAEGAERFSENISGMSDAAGSEADQVGQSFAKTASTASKAGADAGRGFSFGIRGIGSTSTGVMGTVSRSFGSIVGAAGSAARGASAAMQNGLSSIGSWAARTMDSARSQISRGMSIMSESARGMGDTLVQGFRRGEQAAGRIPPVMRMAAGAIAAVAGPIAILKGGFDRLMGMQKSEIIFKNIGLSAQQTKDQMEKLSDQVTGTSVSLADAAQRSAAFAQAGVKMGKPMDEAIHAFTSLSAASQGSGVDVGMVLQQISAQGKVTGGDLMQLSTAGINATSYLADETGMSMEEVSKAVSAGQIDFETFVAAINHGTGDLAKEMGETLPAKISNMKTAFSNLGATLLTPVIPILTAAVTGLTEGIKAAVKWIKDFSSWLNAGTAPANAMKNALKGIGAVITVAVLPGLANMAAGFMSGLWKSTYVNAAITDFIEGAKGFWSRALGITRGLMITVGGWVKAGAAATVNAGKMALGWIIAAPKNIFKFTRAFALMIAGWVRTAAVATVNAVKMAAAWIIAAPKNISQYTQTFGVIIAGWARAAGAALINAGRMAIAWIMAAPKNIPIMVAAFGTMVAGWVSTAASAIASAAVIATAWIISLGPIALVIAAVAAVVGVFVALWFKSEAFRDFFIGLWHSIVDATVWAWNTIKDFVMGAWNAIVGFFSGVDWGGIWGGIVEAAQTAWEFLTTLWSGAVDFFGGVFGGIASNIGAVFDVFVTAVQWAWETVLQPIYSWIAETWGKIAELLTPAWDTIGQKIGEFGAWFAEFWSGTLWPLLSQVIGFFQKVGEKIGEFISQHWSVLKPILIALGTIILLPIVIALGTLVAAITAVVGVVGLVVAAITGFIYLLVKLPGWIGSVVSAVGNWFARMWQNVKDTFAKAGRAIGDWWRNHVAPLPGRVGEAIGGVIRWFTSLPGRIGSAFAGAGRWLYSAGQDIVRGLLNGIGSLAGTIGSWFLDKIPGWIKTPFMKALGIHSPSRVFHGLGRNIGEGLIEGISSMGSQVQAASQSMADRAAAVNVKAPAVGARQVTPVAAPASAGAVAAPAGALSSAGGFGTGGDGTGLVLPTDETVQPVQDALSTVDVALQTTGQNATDLVTLSWNPAMAGVRADSDMTAAWVQNDAATRINPALQSVGMNVWGMLNTAVNPALAGMRFASDITAGNMQFNAGARINPALNSVGHTSWNVLNGSVNPALSGMRSAVAWTANSFAVGASNIAAHWSRVREATAAPVRFAINTVFNGGLRGMWNSASDLLGTPKMAPFVAHFASGGHVRGPGGKRDDKVPAMLSDGEYVVQAKAVDKIGIKNLNALNSGAVGVAPGILRDRQQRQALMNDRTFKNIASRYAGGGIVRGSHAYRMLMKGIRWAKSRSGRPYVFGGDAAGSGGTDCSGYQSGIADVILGGVGHRQWATGNFPGSQAGAWGRGLASGFAVGIKNGGPGGGHTAGTIGGTAGIPAYNVESGGSPSLVKFVTNAVGANDGYFNQHYHMITLGGQRFKPGLGSGGVDLGQMAMDVAAPWKNKSRRAAQAYAAGGPGLMRQLPLAVHNKLSAAIEKKIAEEAEKMMGDPGGEGVARWEPMVRRALAWTGFPVTPANIRAMLAQIASESGGIPNRAQEIVDVNGTGASAGLGLLQIIPTTFADNRDPRLPNDRTNPFANMVAALRYFKGRYGMNLPAVWGHGHGYDLGGMLAGTGLFSKQTTEAERVLSPRQTRAFEEMVTWLDRNEDVLAGSSASSDVGGSRSTRTIEVTQVFNGNMDSEDVGRAVERRLMRSVN